MFGLSSRCIPEYPVSSIKYQASNIDPVITTAMRLPLHK
jgi:hypothetical protein